MREVPNSAEPLGREDPVTRRRNRLNWGLVGVVGLFAAGLVWGESKWAWSYLDWFFIIGSILLVPPVCAFFSLRFVLDCKDWLCEKPDRFYQNRPYHLAFGVIVVLSLLAITQNWGSRLRVLVDRKQIVRTLDSVAKKCANPTAPDPQFRGSAVRYWNCTDGSFTAGFDSNLFESHGWGFLRGKPSKDRFQSAELAFDDVWVVYYGGRRT
jgi:hypothetical protein